MYVDFYEQFQHNNYIIIGLSQRWEFFHSVEEGTNEHSVSCHDLLLPSTGTYHRTKNASENDWHVVQISPCNVQMIWTCHSI